MTPLSAGTSIGALKEWKGERVDDRLMQPAGGIEAEFTLLVNDRPARPEQVFGDPRGFIDIPLVHRTGRSFHLPNGSAIYFDTGVIEIASPVMTLARGCFGRLARSMEVSIACVRDQLDGWERRTGQRVRLRGFSTHYNVSVSDGAGGGEVSNRVHDLAWALMHVLPAPVMLLGTNRRSTGVGVRPRSRRIEVTADFPPDPAHLAATGTVVAGIVSAIKDWRDLTMESMSRRRIPVINRFRPIKHTSRRGWLARAECYPQNPFSCEPNDPVWQTSRGTLSLRQIALAVFDVFRSAIRRLADPFSYRVARRILTGRSKSWLDEPDRPITYDDVGRGTLMPEALGRLGLDRYERVMLKAIESRPLRLGNECWRPVGVRGWSRVVFRRDSDGARTVLPLDSLVEHLDAW
jgi:hypothetical protein